MIWPCPIQIVNSMPLMSLDPHVNNNGIHIRRKLKSFQLPRPTKHPVVISHSHIDRYIKAQIDRYIPMFLCKQNLRSWHTQFINWCYWILNVIYISGMMQFWNCNSKVVVCYFHLSNLYGIYYIFHASSFVYAITYVRWSMHPYCV